MGQYSTDTRYTATSGRVFLTGVQALTRILVDQLRVDRAAGRRTAAFVSGYPGSPLGGFDLEMSRLLSRVKDLPIVHQPGVNEELGLTAVMGSQLVGGQDDKIYDGVVGLWYGKAPGFDRAGDAIRHAVFTGTDPAGGAVALVGDDPSAKSSTLPSSSDVSFVDMKMPVFYPGSVGEISRLGLHAVAVSRLSGLWSAIKVVTPVADGTAAIELDALSFAPRIPQTDYRCRPSAMFLGARTLVTEQELFGIRTELALRYGIENQLNRIVVDSPDAWIGLLASGYTYHQMRAALRRLGLASDQDLAAAGIRLLHLQMPVPFDRDLVRQFARGLQEILVVEEKNPTLEVWVRDALYGRSDQPLVLGKSGADGGPLLPAHGQLDADAMIAGVRARLAQRLQARLAPLPAVSRVDDLPLTVARKPYFCSGCPHSWGVKTVEGVLVGAGTGCHGMSLLMDEGRVGQTHGITCMGNEGSNWIGMAPFLERQHSVQNLGDGTYFHSAQLAVQAAVGASVSITYKLLYNHTVAMTGGQDPPTVLAVPELVGTLLAFGVKEVLITTDEVEKYSHLGLPEGVQVWPRQRIVEAQELLAQVAGVTVLIHDQACATELRRGRKRGLIETPRQRVVINPRVCEGCGDCGDVSGCLSVQPYDTPFGRKTRIDQATCNLDYTCLDGDCPAFMTVTAPRIWRRQKGRQTRPAPPEPPLVAAPRSSLIEADRVAIRMVGIGGTGVVTVAQVLGTAATLAGWQVAGLDQTGLAQKAGPVVSDVLLSRHEPLFSNLIGRQEADLILAFDLLAGTTAANLEVASAARTVLIGSTVIVPTGDMVVDPSLAAPNVDQLSGRAAAVTRDEHNRWVDSPRLARRLAGEPATANILLLGVATQAGQVPIPPAAIEQAIELNGVAIAANLRAFRWGRAWWADPEAVAAQLPAVAPPLTLDERVDFLAADLSAYQNAAYAKTFRQRVAAVSTAEDEAVAGSRQLASAYASCLHKLMAYKDEYEVARLLLLPEARQAAEEVAGAGARSSWNLHPPMLKALGMNSKFRIARWWGVPLMGALRAAKRVRGTPFDPFGWMGMRKLERQLIDEYVAALDQVVTRLSAENLEQATAIAELPDQVRGYEELKQCRAAAYQVELAAKVAAFIG